MKTEYTLAARAVLAAVNISEWQARKLDREVTDKANEAANAKADAGRFNKLLIAKESLQGISKIVSMARGKHAVLTLPWRADGARILPAKHFLAYQGAMGALQSEFAVKVDEFIEGYPAYVEQSKARLGGMFREEDYPKPEEIYAKFKFSMSIDPIPTSGDFRVDIGEAALADLQAELQAKADDTMKNAMRNVWERIADATGAMVERLNAYKPAAKKGDKAEGVFRDSLVENLRELVGILPALNIAEDSRLDDIVARMKAELIGNDAEALREYAGVRETTAKKAADILADVRAMMG